MRKIVFDPDKCTACGACALACMDQNDIDIEAGERPFRNIYTWEKKGGHQEYYSVSCAHCEEAPCVIACPSSCLYKDPDTGLTLYDSHYCIGCHSCAMACPSGIPTFNKMGKMQKCNGCIDRQKAGMLPACVKICPSGALTLEIIE